MKWFGFRAIGPNAVIIGSTVITSVANTAGTIGDVATAMIPAIIATTTVNDLGTSACSEMPALGPAFSFPIKDVVAGSVKRPI